jgi:hypothetical protein
MKTENFRLDTIFNGGFCAKFSSSNVGEGTCDNFAVEVNMDPATWELQKFTSSLAKIGEDATKGALLWLCTCHTSMPIVGFVHVPRESRGLCMLRSYFLLSCR